MDCGPDRAAADGRLSRALVTRDEQEDAISALYRLVESVIDCAPCSVEGHAVQVDGAVRLESTVAEPTVPCAIERSCPVCAVPDEASAGRPGAPLRP